MKNSKQHMKKMLNYLDYITIDIVFDIGKFRNISTTSALSCVKDPSIFMPFKLTKMSLFLEEKWNIETEFNVLIRKNIAILIYPIIYHYNISIYTNCSLYTFESVEQVNKLVLPYFRCKALAKIPSSSREQNAWRNAPSLRLIVLMNPPRDSSLSISSLGYRTKISDTRELLSN